MWRLRWEGSSWMRSVEWERSRTILTILSPNFLRAMVALRCIVGEWESQRRRIVRTAGRQTHSSTSSWSVRSHITVFPVHLIRYVNAQFYPNLTGIIFLTVSKIPVMEVFGSLKCLIILNIT